MIGLIQIQRWSLRRLLEVQLIQFVQAKCVLCWNMLQTVCQTNTLGMLNSFILFRGCVWAACLALQTNCQADILATHPHFSRTGTLARVGICVWGLFFKTRNELKCRISLKNVFLGEGQEVCLMSYFVKFSFSGRQVRAFFGTFHHIWDLVTTVTIKRD